MGSWTGTVPSFVAGQRVPGSDLQTMADIATALTAGWTSYTATTSGITVGDGTVTSAYRRLHLGSIDIRWKFVMGSTSAIAGPVTVDIPSGLTISSGLAANVDWVGQVLLTDTGTATRVGPVLISDTNTLGVWSLSNTGVVTAITNLVPHTWTNTDVLSFKVLGLELV